MSSSTLMGNAATHSQPDSESQGLVHQDRSPGKSTRRITPALLEKVTELKTKFPSVHEFEYLQRHSSNPEMKERVHHLLEVFKHQPIGLENQFADAWYGQLDALYKVASELGDTEAMEKAEKFNNEVRCKSANVHIVKDKTDLNELEKGLQDIQSNNMQTTPLQFCNVSNADGQRCAPAVDPAVMFKSERTVSMKITKEGYHFEEKEFGKQHAVPSLEKLTEIKGKCIHEIEKNYAFVQAVESKAGKGLVREFNRTASKPFDLEEFHACTENGLSRADLYTFLPVILEHKIRSCNPKFEFLKALYGEVAMFRDIFGSLCNPLADYMPIFEAIMDLCEKVEDLVMLLRALGGIILGMFGGIFSAVLDVLGGVIGVCDTRLGAGMLMGGGSALLAMGLVAMIVPVVGAVASMCMIVGGAAMLGGGLASWFNRDNQRGAAAIYLYNAAGTWRVWALNAMQGA